MKNIAKILCFVLSLVLVFSVIGVSAFAEEATVVTTAADLKSKVEAGGNVQLGGDITTDAPFVTTGVTTVIDLNGYTLTIGAGDNKFKDESNITIKNGTINITGVTVGGNAIFCLDEYGAEGEKTTLTLDDVDVVGNGYSSAYGIFYIGKYSELNVNGGDWNLANDTFSAGGVFKADASTAVLNITGLTVEAHNVRRFVTYAATVIDNSTIAISGDADGVDAEMEHGFNRSPLTIKNNSTVTMENIVGRGITAENGAVNIEGSTVSIRNAKEASIDLRGGQTLTVDADSSVALDKAPTITSGSFAGEGSVEYGTLSAVYVDNTSYWGECGGSADESFEFKFYCDTSWGESILMGVSSLNNIEGIIDGDVYVTWSLSLNGVPSTTSYWSNEWYQRPTIDMQPNRVVQVVDGVEVAESSIQLNAPDDINEIVALTANADGYITGFYTSLSTALNTDAPNVVVLRDITEAITSIADVTLISGVESGVTITNTATGVVDFDNVNLNWGVTLNVANIYSGGSENYINGTLNVSGTYEHSWDAYTEVNGKATVNNLVIADNNGEGAFVVWGELVCGTLSIDSGTLSLVYSTLECENLVATGTAKFAVNGATLEVTNYNFDADLDFKVVDNGDGTITIVEKHYVAQVDGKGYEDLVTALKALKDDSVLTLLEDITIDTEWNRSGTGSYITKSVTIEGNGYTLTYTGSIKDTNAYGLFRFTGANTVINNLTIDASAATFGSKHMAIIDTLYNVELNNVTLIGNGNRSGLMYGHGAGTESVTAVVKGCSFSGVTNGVTDNMNYPNYPESKSVSITDSTFNGARVNLSASESIVFTGNTVSGASLSITSYTAKETLEVKVLDNVLDPAFDHTVSAGKGSVQPEASVNAPGIPSIGENGNWWIGNVDTGYIAAPQITIVDGYWYINGESTGIRAESQNGYNPELGFADVDGVKYWTIDLDGEGGNDPVVTNVKAEGIDGVGIENIKKQSSDGNVDTYVITFTDKALPPVVFTVTNGLDGNQGAPGLPGIEGPQGLPGNQGAPGENGYDGSDVVMIAVAVTAVCVLITIVVLGRRVFKRNPFALNF